jgi:hypothetical protein
MTTPAKQRMRKSRAHRRLGLRPVQVLVSEQDIDFLLARDYELTRSDDRSIGGAVSAFRRAMGWLKPSSARLNGLCPHQSAPECGDRDASTAIVDHTLQRGSPAQGSRILFTPRVHCCSRKSLTVSGHSGATNTCECPTQGAHVLMRANNPYDLRRRHRSFSEWVESSAVIANAVRHRIHPRRLDGSIPISAF